jgi:SAM-dependent methyltransferase
MAALHATTYFADGDGWDSHLHAFEVDGLGDLTGLRICHLQSHLGGDSLSLSRLGATVVGVDFSAAAVAIAAQRAEREGLDGRVSFVCAAVEDASSAAGTGFDAVYTSWGVLCWLPDLDVWASAIHTLLRPGGWLYLAETHPYATAVRWADYSYGGGKPVHNVDQGDYTDPDAHFDHPESWEWPHGLGEVITSVASAGLRVDFVHEHDVATWHLNDPNLVPASDRTWRAEGSTVPLSFTLRATRS